MRRRMDGDLETRFQAPKRVGPPIRNQGPSRLDSLQAVGYYGNYGAKKISRVLRLLGRL